MTTIPCPAAPHFGRSAGTLRRLATALLLGALCLPAVPASAEDPAPPAPPAKDGGAGVDAALEKAMEDAFREVERDYRALKGETAAALRASLLEGLAPDLDSTALAAVWTGRGLLGTIVAPRVASRFLLLRMAPPEDVKGEDALLALAVEGVFPRATVHLNWDHEFLDLEVVTRWRAAAGLPPAGRSGDAAAAPDRPAPEGEAWDPADMVLVPRGDLHVPDGRGRGWPDDAQKEGRISVKAFYMDRTEVPASAYGTFLRTVKDRKVRERITPAGWAMDEKGFATVPEGRGKHPVTGIPYEGAYLFAEHHGKRLPTEDEWERAARGDEGLLYPWGAEWQLGAAIVARPEHGTAPVGSTPGDRSPFGILDLCGNVSEVCATYVDGKPVKGLPRDSDQVVRRGGHFEGTTENAASDYRYVIGPTSMARTPQVGFRCAMDEREFKKKYGK